MGRNIVRLTNNYLNIGCQDFDQAIFLSALKLLDVVHN